MGQEIHPASYTRKTAYNVEIALTDFFCPYPSGEDIVGWQCEWLQIDRAELKRCVTTCLQSTNFRTFARFNINEGH